MTNFEKLKSMNEKEISEFLDSIVSIDDNPQVVWFYKKYCDNCETIRLNTLDPNARCDYAYCELNENCRYFQNKDDIFDNKEMIELWLESEVE